MNWQRRLQMVQKNTLNNYFENSWKPNYNKFKYSGWALLDKIDKNKTILDVGCGYNLFKEHFGNNLYGIDPANDEADERISIEDFNSAGNQWDIILCLGSLNFGDESIVKPQVEKVVSLCKKGGIIYWRQNPGLGDHPWKGVEAIQFFPWSIDINYEWANEFGCQVQQCIMDTGDRIYAEWTK
jgi:2-polyprenyl-3-methyl-5-hydroxy-6-metoxy-1,4-benzoquinol methylase